MAEYILDVVKQTSKLDWAFPFQRTGGFPLDRSSLFSSLSDAQAYALGGESDERKLGGTSYVGQPISVYDADSQNVTLYIIDADRSLKEVGSASVGDNLSIENVDGKLQLKDFGVGYYAYHPSEKDDEGNVTKESSYEYVEGFKAGLEPRVISVDGEFVLAWYEPGSETVEDIATNVETVTQQVEDIDNLLNKEGGLVDQVDNLEKEIGQAADDAGNAATGLYGEIAKLDATKANAADVYTKTETDSAISTAVANAAHLKRVIVNTVDDIDTTASDAELYIYMVPTGLQAEDDKYDEYIVIDGFVEKVGSWEVSFEGYATTQYVDDELAKKVDADENSRLMTNAEGQKLATIEEGAEKNYVTEVAEEFNVDSNGKLTLTSVSEDKVVGLTDKLGEIDESISDLETEVSNKVDKVENSRLMTNDEGDKLAAIKDLIQSVNATNFTISAEGQLNLNDIDISKITGLQTQLNAKVTQVYSEDGTAWTLLSPENQAKLAALVLDGEDVSISGKVNADNVEGLGSWITTHRNGIAGLLSELDKAKLDGIAEGAEKNFISSVETAEFNVDEVGKLSLVSIDPSKITNLTALLEAKANQTAVTSLSDSFLQFQSTMNSEISTLSTRMDDVENRLTWQSV